MQRFKAAKHKVVRRWSATAMSLVIIGGILFTFEKRLRAKFEPIETIAHIQIDGQYFGTIDQISELRDLHIYKQHPDENFTRVSLKRDFVTDPSLYFWAKRSFETREGLKDIKLVMKTKDGHEISEYVLKKSKPLQWTLEAADPAVGGFHERIEFAVQEIAIH